MKESVKIHTPRRFASERTCALSIGAPPRIRCTRSLRSAVRTVSTTSGEVSLAPTLTANGTFVTNQNKSLLCRLNETLTE